MGSDHRGITGSDIGVDGMDDKKIAFIRNGLLALALAFVCIGVLRGEPQIVWKKAVNICLECIGIG